MRSTRGSGLPGCRVALRSGRSTSAAGRRRSCRPTRSPVRCRPRPRAVRPRGRRRGHARGEPGCRTSAATPRRSAGRRARGSRSGPRACSRAELRRLGRRHRPADVGGGGRRRPRRGDRVGQPRPALRRAGPDRWRAGSDSLEAALDARAGPPLALRADARRSRRRGPDRAGGDHLPTSAGARRWRERPQRSRTRTARPPSTTTPSIAWPTTAGAATRSPTGRGPGHESRHNLAYWERRPYEAVGPGAHAFDGVVRRWNAARLDGYLAALVPAPGRHLRLPPGGVRGRSTPATAAAEARHPRPAHGPRRPARRRRRATPSGAVFGWALGDRAARDGRRRPDPPDDARPAPLERGVRPPGLNRRRPPAAARRSRRAALTLATAGCYDAPSIVSTHT